MREGRQLLPVWFFIGLLLLIYGVLILVSGVVEWRHPAYTVLSNLHAPVWWGALLILIGAVYTYLFSPHKRK